MSHRVGTAASRTDDALRQVFTEHGSARAVEAGASLFLEGDRSSSVFIVLTGLLRIEKTTLDGRIVLLDLAANGDLVGELGVVHRNPRSASTWAIEPTTLIEIPAADFLQILETVPEVAMAVLERTGERLGEITFQLVETSQYTAAARVAARLVRLAEMADVALDGDPVDLKLPISQQDIGQWAGLAREGVASGLKQLRNAGVLSTERLKVTIHQPQLLREIGQGERTAVQG